MEKRKKNIVVRVTDKELVIIKEKADKAGLSISSYLRSLGLQEK